MYHCNTEDKWPQTSSKAIVQLLPTAAHICTVHLHKLAFQLHDRLRKAVAASHRYHSDTGDMQWMHVCHGQCYGGHSHAALYFIMSIHCLSKVRLPQHHEHTCTQVW